jgi:sulfate adenylyltransferase
LSKGLGFSREDRDANVTRIGFVASEIARHGGIAVAAPIAPFASARAEVRRLVEAAGEFIEVHVSTPLAVCEARDRKGLYAKARSGELKQFTGISDPYEVPEAPEIRIEAEGADPYVQIDAVLELLRRRRVLD